MFGDKFDPGRVCENMCYKSYCKLVKYSNIEIMTFKSFISQPITGQFVEFYKLSCRYYVCKEDDDMWLNVTK